jgi:hypothetical protein
MSEFERVQQSIGAAINILAKTIDLFDKAKTSQVNANDLINLMKEVDSNKGELKWAMDKLKDVKVNPFHLDFIKIHSEKHSTDMAIRLLTAMKDTSPGKSYPSPQEMATTLGLTNTANRGRFMEGYQETVQKLENSAAPDSTKSINIWYWICMSMFGSFAFLIALWIARMFYEWVQHIRKRFAEFVMPKGPLSKFKLFTFVRQGKKRTFQFPTFLPMIGPRVSATTDFDE